MIQTRVQSDRPKRPTAPTGRRGRRRFDPERYGPWAVVTGASSGIGRGFAERLAAEGLDVVLAARRTDLLHELGEHLSATHGVAHRVVTVDLSEPDGPARLVAATDDLDVGSVVSNAGTGIPPSTFVSNERDDLHRIVRLNVGAHLDLAHHFGRRLAERGRGGMVLVSAGGALHGLPYMVNESATKAYVLNLGEGLHHELRPRGVDVTVLLPGSVETPIIDRFGIDRASMPVRPQPVEACVDETLRALRKGRATHVSGRMMRTATRLTPRSVSIRVNSRMLARASRRVAVGAEAGADVVGSAR
ncbi:MAG: SDR family NAD(P)-dependent oxidoreductase [Actinomycetota bacterium]|nr:SDR family NAD(P)-dependent oxidoreductase [Actinomycetota bacterium]